MLPNTLKPVLPWESTISTYGLSKIFQVSCHRCRQSKLLSKYAWLISAEKISFVRSCYGSNKSDGLHNKGPYTRGNIKWRSFALRFCVSNAKSAWQPLLPSVKGLSFTLCLSQGDPHLSLFHFILWQALCVRVILIYISNWMQVSMNYYCWHYPWGKRLWGKTISPYLSLCPVKTP